MNEQADMKVSTEDIRKLREATGAAVMACKQALAANNNNHELAAKFLREKGIAKRSAEGLSNFGYIGIASHDMRCAMIEVMSQTDFVSKTDQFRNACNLLAEYIAKNASNYFEKAKATFNKKFMKLDDFAENENLINIFTSMGESIMIGRCHIFNLESSSNIYSYVHANSPDNVFFSVVQLRNANEMGQVIAKTMALYAHYTKEDVYQQPLIGEVDEDMTLSDVLKIDDIIALTRGKVGNMDIGL